MNIRDSVIPTLYADHFPRRLLWYFLAASFSTWMLNPTPAKAECDESEIVRMSEKGRTIARIAKRCDMDPEEISEILEDARSGQQGSSGTGGTSGGGNGQNNGLPRGQTVLNCGCWGNVMPGAQIPYPACQSRYAIPSPCQAMCPTGGLMWYATCG